jgi:hypothetical protein
VAVGVADVRLEPATVRAGDVYVVLEEGTISVVFVHRKAAANDAPGPLTEADIARLGAGDAQGTSMESVEPSACPLDQQAADRGNLKVPGGCGNIFKLDELRAGRYAFLATDPATLQPGATVPMGILEVSP